MRQIKFVTFFLCLIFAVMFATPAVHASSRAQGASSSHMTLMYRSVFVPASEIEVCDNLILVLTRGRLRIYDNRTPENPQFLSELDLGGAGGLSVVGDYAYVDGIRIIDISDPSAPFEVGRLDIGGRTSVVGNYAYVVGSASYFEHKVSVVNITNPSAPWVVGTYTGSSDMLNGQTAAAQNLYLLPRFGTHGFSGIETVNVSNPAQPTQRAIFDAGAGYPQDIEVTGDVAYIAQIKEWDGTSYGGGGVFTMNANAPTGMSRLPNSSQIEGAYDVEVTAEVAALLTTNSGAKGMQIFDIAPLNSSHEVANYQGTELASVTDIAVRDGFLYAALGDGGWAIYCYGGALNTDDVGLRPCPDGYAFKNWSAQPDPYEGELNLSHLYTMYGDGVCIPFLSGCVVRPSTEAWLRNQVLGQMKSQGHCLGIAVTVARFFMGLESPSRFDPAAHTPHDLIRTMPLRQEIALYHMTQYNEWYKATYRAGEGNSIAESRAQIQDLLHAGEPAVLVLVPDPTILKSHAVNAFSIRMQTPGVWAVQIYDNGSHEPYTDPVWRTLILDEEREVWYLMDGVGDHTGPVIPMPLANFSLPQPCPPEACGANVVSDVVHIALQGAGHVLTTAAGGGQIGFTGSTFVNTLGGSVAYPALAGLEREVEPDYEVPVTDAYTIEVSGATVTQAGSTSLHLVGAEGSFSIDEVAVQPDGRDVVHLSEDGRLLTFEPDGVQRVTFGVTTSTPERDVRILLSGVPVAAETTTTLGLLSGSLTFRNEQSTGVYSLYVETQTSNGELRFRHSAVPISANDTQSLRYEAWNGGPLVVDIDEGSDGTIDRSITLDNQYTGLYMPLIGKLE